MIVDVMALFWPNMCDGDTDDGWNEQRHPAATDYCVYHHRRHNQSEESDDSLVEGAVDGVRDGPVHGVLAQVRHENIRRCRQHHHSDFPKHVCHREEEQSIPPEK